jgi:hypothetical protein
VNQGYARTLFAQKVGDQSVTSSTTLVDCTGISVAVAASSTYEFRLSLFLVQGGGGLDAKIIVPSGATVHGKWDVLSDDAGTTFLLPTDIEVNVQNAIMDTFSTTNPQYWSTFTVKTDVTAGTVKFQFAQTSSNIVASTVQDGSWIIATKVA